MDGRQGSSDKAHTERGLSPGVWRAFLRTGAVLAIFRVSVLAWVEYGYLRRQNLESVYDLIGWCLRPETLLGGYTRVGAIHFESLTSHFLFWGSLLTVGSFLIATPILIAGWLTHKPR